MITAVFQNNDDYARAYGLWQWDYGQQLRIQGLHLPTAVEIHFALQETGGESISRVGVTKDGVTTVTIPDSMLEGSSAAWVEKTYNIHAWIYLSDRTSGETIKRITMQVKARPKPEAFEAPGNGEIFHEAIEAVNDAAKRAEEAGGKAAAAADDAREAAAQTAEHLEAVQGLTEQVEINADTVAQDKQAVAGMLSQVQSAASEAALSAQAAKLSETAAGQAQTGAEAAEDGARQYAGEAEADRRTVAEDKQTVTQIREAVATDRQAVEQTAAQFGQASQDALTAIGQAQSTAVGAVKTEGQKQTTAVQEAGIQAVNRVVEAKTTAVQAVTAEGDKQTKRVQEAAAGVEADREQISQNKADIAGLAEGMTELAPAIHSTASGSVITANDATEGRPFRGLRVFGRTEQVRTTGKNLFDVEFSKLSENYKEVMVGNDKLFTVEYSLKPNTKYSFSCEIDKTASAFNIATTTKRYVVFDSPKRTIQTETDGIFYVGFSSGVKPEFFDNAIRNVQLEESDASTAYEPYTGGKPSPNPEYPQEITSAGDDGNVEVDVCGKNLLTGRMYYARYSNGIARLVNETDVTLPYAPIREADGIGYVVPCIAGKQYTLSVTNSNKNAVVGIAEYKSLEYVKDEKNTIGFVHMTPDKVSYTAKATGVLVCGIAGKWTDGNTTIHECTESELLQLEIGSEATPYEPPRTPQTLTLQTPNGLPGVPVSKDGNYTDENGQRWVCDEVDLGSGKYVQRVAEYVWNPNNNFSIDKNAIHINSILVDLKVNDASNYSTLKGYYILCNGLNAHTKSGSLYNTDEVGCGYTDNSNFLRARLPIEAGTTYESVKAYLTKLPYILKFLYILATPVERDLTPEEIAAYKALRTYGPTTVVSNDAGAGMEVTYVADTKTYIDNKFAALNKAVLDAVGGT